MANISAREAATQTLDGTLPYEESWRVCAEGLIEALDALQTALHHLGEEGYFSDPDYPEINAALATYEQLWGV